MVSGLRLSDTLRPGYFSRRQFCRAESFGDVVLYGRLHSALKRINRQYSDKVIDELVKKITRQQSLSISQNNSVFHKIITDGIDVEVRKKDGSVKTEKAYILDLIDIENNEFLAINQYTIIENGKERRPDVVVFINGIPLAVIELKRLPTRMSALWKAFMNCRRIKQIYQRFLTIMPF